MTIFFAAASLWAALAVPMWIATWTGAWTACSLCSSPSGHAASLLGGYALAVIAGFLLHRLKPAHMAALFATWLVARLPGLIELPPAVATAGMLPFPLLLLHQTVPRFTRAAKGGHNRMFAPVLVVLVALITLLGIASVLDPGLVPELPAAAVLAVSLLLFTMGGRIIPAATAGALRAKSRHLEDRVQRPLEWVGVAGLSAAILGLMAGVLVLAGAALFVAGIATLGRIARWRGLELRDRPDIWGLHLGYAWLGVGLLLTAASQFGIIPRDGGLHALMVGGLGTIAATMMARTVRQRSRRPAHFGAPETIVLLLVSLAAALRVGAVFGPMDLLILGAGIAWSAAHFLLLYCLLVPGRSPLRPSGRAVTST